MTVPAQVLEAFALEGLPLTPISVGLINRTFRVDRDGTPWLALQELHPVFKGEVNLDLDAITTHLAAQGLATPRLHRTRTGAPFLEAEGRPWRALTWLPGRVHLSVSSPSIARAAAGLVAKFHAATSGLVHAFAFERPGAHDTAAHLARLGAALDRGSPSVRALGARILAHPLPAIPPLPTRIVHGDLKITNILFDEEGTRAVALLDLDTLAYGTLATELGDALRSWCNPAGESAERVAVDEAIFAAAIEGYAAGDPGITPSEVAALVPGLETIALELASRFCLDAIEDRYFGWDPTRFPSRVAHDERRAEAQLALAESVARARPRLEALVRLAF